MELTVDRSRGNGTQNFHAHIHTQNTVVFIISDDTEAPNKFLFQFSSDQSWTFTDRVVRGK